MRYVVTAINCLSGLRAIISLPMEIEDARRLVRKWRKIPSFMPYTRYRIEQYDDSQLTFDFFKETI